jgi:hypothetical protein
MRHDRARQHKPAQHKIRWIWGLGFKKAHSIGCKYKQAGWLKKTSLTLTSRALLQTALFHHQLIAANGLFPLELSEGVGQDLFPQQNGELAGVVVSWG